MTMRCLTQQRRVPVIFSILGVLICVSVVLLIDDQHALFTALDPRFSFSTPPSPALNISTPPTSELQSATLNFLSERAPSPLHQPASNLQSLSSSYPPPLTLHRTFSNASSTESEMKWLLCVEGSRPSDYIPCLDNAKAIKALKSWRRREHMERHCPHPCPRCLVPLPQGYRVPVRWPKSRDMIWFNNNPHPKLVEYKKDQNWVRKLGDYFVFPGGGTQFKEGVTNYIRLIEKTLPAIKWGKHIRVVLDVGCGVASFGGYLFEKNVLTMSFAPKDGHDAQVQFALERGILATLSVIGTQKLTFPDNAYDLIHCARCRIHWEEDGGKPILELNRILRPGGFFVWSATPIYLHNERDENVWKAMVTLTQSICWKAVAKTVDSKKGTGLVIYQKPNSSSCYKKRRESNPPMCDRTVRRNSSWHVPLCSCLTQLPEGAGRSYSWPLPWPKRLRSRPPSLSTEPEAEEIFYMDTKHWSSLVSDVYMNTSSINWSYLRNVMDMNAGFGGFAAALINLPLWVLNVVPIDAPDTLSVIFDRGLIGTYHDWCESFNTYPRTYDLLHANFLFGNLTQRCEMIDVVVEMDRILRPEGQVLVRDTMEAMAKLPPLLDSLHWSLTLHTQHFLIAKKSFWRPQP